MPIELQGNSINNLDIASASITSPVNVVATSSATGTLCIQTAAFNCPFSGDFYVEVTVPYLTKGTTTLDIELFSGVSAAAGTFLTTLSGHMTVSVTLGIGVLYRQRVTLVAGANQLTVTGFVDGGTGVFGAGAGTTGNVPPARIRVRST